MSKQEQLSKRARLIAAGSMFAIVFTFAVATNCARPVKQATIVDVAETGDDKAILVTMSDKTTKTLVSDKDSIFRVMALTDDKVWAMVSVMPADPEYAKGVSEYFNLYYVPRLQKIPVDSIAPHPGRWFLLSVETKDGKNVAAFSCSDECPDTSEKSVPLRAPSPR
jgi:hypothetical protein